MRALSVSRVFLAVIIAAAITIASTFIGGRSASATYAEVMGCEVSCRVAATGWPLIFVRDYTGMSVVNTADILEVMFAADRLDPRAMILNILFWSVICLGIARIVRR